MSRRRGQECWRIDSPLRGELGERQIRKKTREKEAKNRNKTRRKWQGTTKISGQKGWTESTVSGKVYIN